MEKKSSGAIMERKDSGDTKDTGEEEDVRKLSVFSLNCWGLYGFSELRQERMKAISDHLRQDVLYDVLLFQEVWCEEDFEHLQRALRPRYPYSHYFDQGVIGSGTCIVSPHRIQYANYHEFAMNGYPTKFWHGDWYAAKGLGLCQVDIEGFNIHVFVSHYHAEYDPNHDVYLGHRVIHALESAQWLNLTSGATDLTLYCGDFNTEPSSVPYRLLRAIVPLADAWMEHSGELWGGETCEVPTNSFTPRNLKDKQGKRIDYIMYRAGPGVMAETNDFWFPMPEKVPDKDYSFSDHEAVASTISIRRPKDKVLLSGPDFRRELSVGNRSECVRAVKDAIEIVDKSMRTVDSDRFKYIVYSFMIMIALVLTFIPSVFIGVGYMLALDIGLFVPRFVLTVFFVIFVLMASLYNRKEKNALKSTKKELQFIVEQDHNLNTT